MKEVNFFKVPISIVGKRNYTGYYRQSSQKKNNSCVFVRFFLLPLPIPWRETYFLTRGKHKSLRPVKIQIKNSTCITNESKLNLACRLWREINNFSIHVFLHRFHLFHLSTEIRRTSSVKDGHQLVDSRADILFTS